MVFGREFQSKQGSNLAGLRRWVPGDYDSNLWDGCTPI